MPRPKDLEPISAEQTLSPDWQATGICSHHLTPEQVINFEKLFYNEALSSGIYPTKEQRKNALGVLKIRAAIHNNAHTTDKNILKTNNALPVELQAPHKRT